MRTSCIAVLTSIGLALLSACVPDLEESDTTVREPRVLAVRAEPAEAAPRQRVELSALYASGDGTLQEAPLDWAFCIDRKALDELGPISRRCLVEADKSEEILAPIGEGDAVDATLPKDGCRLFGPDRPQAKMGEPAGRPVDPDPTGGFYQPLRIFDDEEGRFATFDTRLVCGLPGVTQDQFAEFNRRYRKNQNPEIEELEVVSGRKRTTVEPAADEEPLEVEAGDELTLRVSWEACTRGNECGDDVCGDDETPMTCAADCTTPRGCGGSEHYLYYDRGSEDFVLRRETLRVSWFASAGSFANPHTGRSEAEAKQADSDNTWTAPKKAGEVQVWVVLRDDRGGVAWQSYVFEVR